MGGNKIILGDNFKTDGGKQYIAKDNATLTVNEGQQGPVEELLTLLNEVKQNWRSCLCRKRSGGCRAEVNSALRQAQRNPPDRKKIVDSLREATAILWKLEDCQGGSGRRRILGQGLKYCGGHGRTGSDDLNVGMSHEWNRSHLRG